MSEFKPQVQVVRARVRRVVRIGPYETTEIQSELEAIPDPDRKVGENVALLQRLVLSKVNAECDAIRAANHKEE